MNKKTLSIDTNAEVTEMSGKEFKSVITKILQWTIKTTLEQMKKQSQQEIRNQNQNKMEMLDKKYIIILI